MGGDINSEFLLELMIAITFISSFVAIIIKYMIQPVFKLNKGIEKLDYTIENIDSNLMKTENDIKTIEEDLNELKTKVAVIENMILEISKRR